MKKPKLKTVLTGADFQAMSDIMGGLLDKQSAVLASKKDLESFATKKDLSEAEHRIKTELKVYMHQGFEAVMEGIDAVVGEGIGVKQKI